MCAGGGDTKRAEQAEQRRRQEEDDRQFQTQVGINEVNRIFGNLVQGSDRPALFADPARAVQLTQPDSNFQKDLEDLVLATGENRSDFVAQDGESFDPKSARREILREGARRGSFNFDDSSFLDEVESAFLAFATPEIERQFETSNEKLTQQLARRGSLESSVAADKFADLQRQRGEALSRAATRAKEIRAQRIADLEKARTGIIAQLEATGNTASAANAAVNAVKSASATDTFEPLGAVFDVGLSVGSDVLRQQSDPFAQPTIFSRKQGSGKVIS